MMLFISSSLKPSLKHSIVEISKSKSINEFKYFLLKNTKTICLRTLSSSIVNKKHFYLGASFKNNLSLNNRNRCIIYNNNYLNKTIFYTYNNFNNQSANANQQPASNTSNNEQQRHININRIDTELLANEVSNCLIFLFFVKKLELNFFFNLIFYNFKHKRGVT